MTDTPEGSIGSIGNYYGGLSVKEQDGRFWWSIENYDGDRWEEIPYWLFDALVKFDIFGVGHTERRTSRDRHPRGHTCEGIRVG